jgi:pimeloyl-ACP methyl ester carboxylesterase
MRPRPPRASRTSTPRRRSSPRSRSPTGIGCFCGDLPEEEQQLVYATHYAPAADLFLHNAPGVAWRTKPSWCIVANNDQTVHPDLERASAKRMGATTYDIDSSHVPMLSHPDFVLDVIRAAASGV